MELNLQCFVPTCSDSVRVLRIVFLILYLFCLMSTIVKLGRVSRDQCDLVYHPVCLSVVCVESTIIWGALGVFRGTQPWTFDTGSTLLRRTEPYLSRLTIYPSYHALFVASRLLKALYALTNHIDWTTNFFSPICNETLHQIFYCMPNKCLWFRPPFRYNVFIYIKYFSIEAVTLNISNPNY